MKKIFINIYLFSFISVYSQNLIWKIYDPSNSGLPYYIINEIDIDSTGNKWISTKGTIANTEAIVKFDGLNWTVYNLPPFDNDNNFINNLTIDKYGRKWIGTEYTGLIKFEDTIWTEYNISNSALPSNQINCIAIDHNGNKWIGTDNGLAKFDDFNFTVYNTSNSSIPGNMIQYIAIDDSDNIWIGTWGNGLAKFDGINWNTYLSSYSVLSITIDKNNNKWLGGTFMGGLIKFDGVNSQVYNKSNSGLICADVKTICIDHDGTKWISSYTENAKSWITCEAFVKFDEVNWTLFDTTNSDIPSNSISSIVIDENGNKWLGTTKGLAVYNEKGVVNVILNSNKNILHNNFILYQNYPNPFNPSTIISYTTPFPSYVGIKIYDILGEEIKTIVNEFKQAGTYNIEFHVNDIPSGIYFYQLVAGNIVLTKKMVILQ